MSLGFLPNQAGVNIWLGASDLYRVDCEFAGNHAVEHFLNLCLNPGGTEHQQRAVFRRRRCSFGGE
jgi:hypothetical protein